MFHALATRTRNESRNEKQKGEKKDEKTKEDGKRKKEEKTKEDEKETRNESRRAQPFCRQPQGAASCSVAMFKKVEQLSAFRIKTAGNYFMN